MTRIKLLTVMIVACSAGSAWGWGYDGHRIVGAIALQEMSPEARRVVLDLLATDADAKYHSLPEATLWADDIKGRDHPQHADFRWQSTLHYVNLPTDRDEYQAEVDCKLKTDCPKDIPCPKRDCVVEAVDSYAAVLKDRTHPREHRLIALKFLAHFVGDIHQPLHAGLVEDRGGNDTVITLSRADGSTARHNLHFIWDVTLIAERMDELALLSWQDYATYLYGRVTPDERRSALARMQSDAWVSKSARLAHEVGYRHPAESRSLSNGDVLTADQSRIYRQRSVEVVELRLRQAGIRLGKLLEDLLMRDDG